MSRNVVVLVTLSFLLTLPIAAHGQDRAAEAVNGTHSVRPTGIPRGADDRTVGMSPSSQLSPHEDRVLVEDRAPAVMRRTCVEEPRHRECADLRR